MCAESSHLGSGFGTYTKELLNRLHATNKYEIAEFSCYRDVSVPKIEPWKIYPNAVHKTDKRYQQYNANTSNHFGHWRFNFALADFKPHIVFDVRDYWMFAYQESSLFRKNFAWVLCPTIDSAPQKREWMQTLQSADFVLGHTHWGKNYLTANNPYINTVGVANDAVNPNIFKPHSSKYASKMILGMPTNSFVIGSVMRNQKRKLIADTFEVLSKLKQKYPTENIILYLHTSFPEVTGWDIPDLLLRYDVHNSVYFTYKCKVCNKIQVRKFAEARANCHSCGQHGAFMCSVMNAVSQEELVKIYNSFDVYLQYSICEGFGIPQVEAAACGVPVISVDHGAMHEITSNLGGDLVKLQKTFVEMETGAERVYPDNDDCVNKLSAYMEKKDDISHNMKNSENIRNNLVKHYSWDKTAKVFEELFDSIDVSKYEKNWGIKYNKPNTEHTIKDMPDNRLFVYQIVEEVLNRPDLKYTSMIEDLINSLNIGYVIDGKTVHNMTKENVVKVLEVYMNNTDAYEKMAFGEMKIPEEHQDFIHYA